MEHKSKIHPPDILEIKEMSDKIITESGASSSHTHRFDLIPIEALCRLADRFELGELKHGHNNWRKGKDNKEYIIHRINHIIDHAYKLIGKMDGVILEDGDDDLGGMIWGCAFLSVALNRRKNSSS